jgi:hypothetical protein
MESRTGRLKPRQHVGLFLRITEGMLVGHMVISNVDLFITCVSVYCRNYNSAVNKQAACLLHDVEILGLILTSKVSCQNGVFVVFKIYPDEYRRSCVLY